MKRLMQSLAASLALSIITPCSLAQVPTAGSWGSTGSMSAARFQHSATLLPNGLVLVAGGSDGANAYKSAELYDPATGTWNSTGAMNFARQNHSATLLSNGKVLVVGGDDTNDAEVYDPVIGSWIPTRGTLDMDTSGSTATRLRDGRVLVVQNRAWLYNPELDNWHEAARPSRHAYHAASLLADGRVLISGGIDQLPYSTRDVSAAQIYDPATDKWSDTGPLANPRSSHIALTLRSGKVLVAGGGRGGYQNYPNVVEIYDPQSGNWSETGSAFNFTGGIYGITGTLLRSGDALLAGGSDGVDGAWNIGELFDATADAWKSPKPPALARDGHTATLLPNNQVLVAGGAGCGTSICDSAVLYTPPEGVAPGIDASFTGSWYDPAQGGHGIVLEVLPNNQLAALWFTFDPTGEQQAWFGGVGTINANTATIKVQQPVDGRWIPNFDPTIVIRRDWGTLSFNFSDRDHGIVTFNSNIGYGSGQMNLVRLTQTATQGAGAAAIIGPVTTGSWYDPAQSGHGLMLEVLPQNRIAAIWFAFDPAGNQAWFSGLGSYSGNTAIIDAVVRPTGGRWIPNFSNAAITKQNWGSLKLIFSDCNHGKVEFSSGIGFGSGSMDLTRLTLPAGLACK